MIDRWRTRAMLAMLGAVIACGRTQTSQSGQAPSASVQASATAPASAVPSSAVPAADRLRIAVDRRVELLAILSRIAGDPVYGKAKGPYADDVDEHFAAFNRDPAVFLTATLRKKHGISYDARMRIAVYLDDSFRPRRPLDPLPPGLDDPRFRGVDLAAYLDEVAAFARTSGFDGFFRAHAAYYAALESTFREFLRSRPIIPWFDALFGLRAGADYHLAPAALTWPMSYGVHASLADGREEVMQVMFLEQPDAKGGFVPGEISLELCAHELAHSYVNPIVDAEMKDLEPVATPVFQRVEKAMRASAYGTPTIMMEEAVVRAVTLSYLREKGAPGQAGRSLADQKRLGFLWTDELTGAIDALRKKSQGPIATPALIATVRATLASWNAAQPAP